MKIITKGINPNTIPYRGTCRNCGTVVECLAHEVERSYEDFREIGYNFVKCPVCTVHIVVDKYVAHDGRK